MPVNMVSNTLPPDYAVEQAQIARRQQMAQMLQQQSMQAPSQGQMISGHYVGPGWGDALAKVAGAYLSGSMADDADKQQAGLMQRHAGDRNALLAKALQAREGTPEQPGAPLPDGVEGPVQPTPGVPGSTRKMAEILMGSQDPDLQQLGLQQTMKQDEIIKLGKGDVAYQGGKQLYANTEAPKYHVVSGNLVQEPSAPGQKVTPAFTADSAKEEADKLRSVLTAGGIDPESPQGKQLFTALAMKMSTHQPATQVTTNVSTEKKYGEQFAGKIASADSDMRDAAIKAPDLANRANSIKATLASGKVITGTGADMRLALGKAMGVVGASDKEIIANTESLSVDLARNTLDSIKTSGLGSGSGFSNADRDFLEKAAGGKITLESSTIDRLATLAHKAAQTSADRWNNRVKQIPKSALEGTGIQSDPTVVPSLYAPKRRATDNAQPTMQELFEEAKSRGLVK